MSGDDIDSTADRHRTVVFGPFIGELGWELLYWHGAVRQLCNNDFKEYHRVAVSLEGRQPFYPDVDQFIGITPDQLPKAYSARGYIADGWRHGLPGESSQRGPFHPLNIYSSFRHRKLGRATYIRHWSGESVEPFVHRIIDELKTTFPIGTTFVTPFQINSFGNLSFGHDVSVDPEHLADAATQPSFNSQDLRKLAPNPSARKLVADWLSPERRLVAVFPRSRPFRRTDKNWSRENYLALADYLRTQGFEVAFLGAPGGSYFAGESTGPHLDFVNLSNLDRLNLHLAVLERSKFAIGAMSGSLLVALAAGCPSIIFGDQRQQLRYYEENYLRTSMIYIATLNPNVDDLIPVIETMPT